MEKDKGLHVHYSLYTYSQCIYGIKSCLSVHPLIDKSHDKYTFCKYIPTSIHHKYFFFNQQYFYFPFSNVIYLVKLC